MDTFDVLLKCSGKIKELKGVEVEFRIPFKIPGIQIQGDMSMVGALPSHEKMKLFLLYNSGE